MTKERAEERNNGKHESATGESFADLAARDAGLGVKHIWTATGCPAYRTYDPADCTCSVEWAYGELTALVNA